MENSVLSHKYRDHEIKQVPANLKFNQNNGVFEGYASLFGQVDMGNDMVMPGAFTDCLKKRGLLGIKMLYQHDPHQPVGRWLEIKEDHKGLYVKGTLVRDVSKAKDIYHLMKAGVLDGLSIGFRAIEGRRNNKTGLRFLHKIDLWEISIVTFPMLEGARISAIKRVKNKFQTAGLAKLISNATHKLRQTNLHMKHAY